jgi:hypothetical protein
MSLESELRAVLPPLDPMTGDVIRLIPRREILTVLWPIIAPVKHWFTAVEAVRPHPPGMSYEDRIKHGFARNYRDLNTRDGQVAFLECWWPSAMDGACIAYYARRGREDGIPYPDRTLIRSASITLRRTPTLTHQTIRWGVPTVSTARGKALWDTGSRREVWHIIQSFYDHLVAQGMTSRLTPMDPGDPFRFWAGVPGPAVNHPRSFYLERPDRPITDSAHDWLRGTP